ncbi:hypothetical protein SteCoe_26240 [Stentor coeruleus]|uniref:Uncharacterized protein n=1 Tax=Stentor coeruleus TaxID=5963 RepID=A0A1R2BDC9_9CILI|nr:hypothetical protein SteCoe_26240 [Stentor coeruleus]
MNIELEDPEVIALVLLLKAHMKKKSNLIYQIDSLKIERNYYLFHQDYRDERGLFSKRYNLLNQYYKEKPFTCYPNHTTDLLKYLLYTKKHFDNYLKLPSSFHNFKEDRLLVNSEIKIVKAQRKKYRELSAQLTLYKTLYKRNRARVISNIKKLERIKSLENETKDLDLVLVKYFTEIKRLAKAKDNCIKTYKNYVNSIKAYKDILISYSKAECIVDDKEDNKLALKKLELHIKLLIKAEITEKLNLAKVYMEKYFKLLQRQKLKLTENDKECLKDESTMRKEDVSKLDILDLSLNFLKAEREGLKLPGKSASFAFHRKIFASIDDTLPLIDFDLFTN